MTNLRWTTQAVEDVEAIRNFIANDSDAYADLVVARLLEAVERLERFPRSGLGDVHCGTVALAQTETEPDSEAAGPAQPELESPVATGAALRPLTC